MPGSGSPDTSSGLPNTTAMAAGGTPASNSAFASASTEPGVSSDGLQMMEHPAPSAPANFFAASAIGKFHGVKAATTPIGCVSTSMRLPTSRPCSVRPAMRRACSPPHSRNSADRVISALASASGLPCSRVMVRATASMSPRSRSAAFFNTVPRCHGGTACHSRRPREAASSASSRSAVEAWATSPMLSPVAGFSTSSPALADPSRHLPSITKGNSIVMALVSIR